MKGMTPHKPDDSDKLLTPAEVAAVFRVDPKTVTRWAKGGLIPSVMTLGGHRRYSKAVIDELARERYETYESDDLPSADS